jgi:hypothetical protein
MLLVFPFVKNADKEKEEEVQFSSKEKLDKMLYRRCKSYIGTIHSMGARVIV